MSSDITNSLAVIASQYQTKITEFTYSGADNEQILAPDPRRWYVQFLPGQGGAGQQVLPSPGSTNLNASSGATIPREYKFRDCPSIVGGAFFGNGMLGTSVYIIEVVYLG